MPKAQEQEYRAKYDVYIEKIGKYEVAIKKMELILNGDRQGLMEMKHNIDPEKYTQLNEETKRLAGHGFRVQDKSKEALLRIEKRVGDVQDLADSNMQSIEEQNKQILRINDQLQRMEGTMTRTKRILGVFAKSFCSDKVALCECCLIVVTAALIVAATQLESVK